MLRRSVVSPLMQGPARVLSVGSLSLISAVVILTVPSVGILLTSSAVADPSENFKGAVATARAGTPCGPLRYNPVVEQAAEISNRSTDTYLNHLATDVPVSDPLPGLKILGYGGNKGVLLNGAAKNEADAIKGVLLQGFDKLPDCSYTEFGVSMLRNQSNGYYLTSLVLAGR